jgi:hypothetical protein
MTHCAFSTEATRDLLAHGKDFLEVPTMLVVAMILIQGARSTTTNRQGKGGRVTRPKVEKKLLRPLKSDFRKPRNEKRTEEENNGH